MRMLQYNVFVIGCLKLCPVVTLVRYNRLSGVVRKQQIGKIKVRISEVESCIYILRMAS